MNRFSYYITIDFITSIKITIHVVILIQYTKCILNIITFYLINSLI